MQTIEQHHPDKKNHPELKVPITRKEHQKLHGISPHDTPLSRKMREYDALTKQIVSMKNWRKAFEKDFGTSPDIGLGAIEKCKKKLTKQIAEMVKAEHEKVRHIKGFGSRYLAGILAYAHPNRFPSLRKFLFYCGYTEASKKLKTYNRKIRPVVRLATKSLIIHKDMFYYPLYLRFKSDLKLANPELSPKTIDIKTRNRVGTYLLKEIYGLFRAET